jgi:cytoskeletal protein CcmA (bactofilin family)
MLRKFSKWLLFFPILAILIVLSTSPVMAADLRNGDAIIIASGDIVNDDLYLAAQSIVINGTVNGDVFCVGDLTINGTINGSLTAIGSKVVIEGEITQAARIAAGSIEISGKIGRDLMVAGENIALDGSAVIKRDLVFVANKIHVAALIEDGVKGYGTGDAAIANFKGKVGGDVEITVKELTLESTADIQGNLTYKSAKEAVVQTGAQIGGKITHNIPQADKSSLSLTTIVWFKVIAFLMTLVTGGLIILLLPRRANAAAASIRRKPWLSLGWGALIFFAAPLAILLTFITVVGIPIGLISLVVYIIALYLSQVAVGLFIGCWILGFFSKTESRGGLLGAFALGFAILTLLKLIPIVGTILWFATVFFGIGAMVMSQKNLRATAEAKTTEITTAGITKE